MRQSGLLLDDNRDVSEACVTRPLVEIALVYQGVRICHSRFCIVFCITRLITVCYLCLQILGRLYFARYRIYNEYMCLCRVSTFFGNTFCLVSNCDKNSAARLQSLNHCVVHGQCTFNVPYKPPLLNGNEI